MRALPHLAHDARRQLAQVLLEQAIALEPDYAQALAVLAVSRSFGAHMGWEDPATAIPVVERVALAAVRANGDDPWAHLAVAAATFFAKRFDDALAAVEMALRLNPSFAMAHGYHGLVLADVGRWQEGSAAAQRALRLSPRDPFSAVYHAAGAYAEFAGGNYGEAIRLGRESIRQRPDFAAGYRPLIAAAAMAGDMDLARATLATLRRVQPNFSLAWMASRNLIRDEADRARYLEGFRRAGLE